VRGLRPLADLLLDYGATCSKLCDDGEETALDGLGGAAIGRIVAKPNHIGHIGVEVRQMQRCDASCDAVHLQPGSGLPAPARRLAGQRVVQPQSATDGEAAVGNVVGIAGGPFFLMAVESERADLERDCVRGLADYRRGLGRHVRHLAHRA
jgi:hypothetical protein